LQEFKEWQYELRKGTDSIPAELLKAVGSMGKDELFSICNEI